MGIEGTRIASGTLLPSSSLALQSGDVSGEPSKTSPVPNPLSNPTPKRTVERFLLAQASARDTAPKTPLTVTVIDDFEQKTQNVDAADLTPDLAHGEVIGRQIEAGLPIEPGKSELRTVQASGDQVVGAVVSTVDSITRESAARQGVPPERAKLHQHKINLSIGWSYVEPQDQKALVEALQAFTRQGGRVYIAAGNDFRNDLQSHLQGPGIVYVDGSDGAIGGEPKSGQSARYDNGSDAQCVANSVFVPRTLSNGDIDLNQDDRADVKASELAPQPSSTWTGQAVPHERLLEGDGLATSMGKVYEQMARVDAQSHQMAKTQSPEAAAVWAQTQKDAIVDAEFKGRMVTLDAFHQAAGKWADASVGSTLALSGVDPTAVYVDAKAAYDTLANSDSSTVVFHTAGPDGRLAPLQAPAGAAPLFGTSFAAPQCVIDNERPDSR